MESDAFSFQVVLIPYPCRENPVRDVILFAQHITKELQAAGLSVVCDLDPSRPRRKFSLWEERGVPIRVEINERDIVRDSLTIVDCRPDPAKKYTSVSWSQLSTVLCAMCQET